MVRGGIVLFVFLLVVFTSVSAQTRHYDPRTHRTVTVIRKTEKTETKTVTETKVVKEDLSKPKYPDAIPDNVIIDSIAVHKADHQLLAFRNGRLLKIYPVQLGQTPVGPKHFENDQKTPEGWYYIRSKNAHHRLYYKSLEISYPNAEDIARARKAMRSAGDGILIHGLPNEDANVGPERYANDWTLGCIALRNPMLDELFDHTDVNTPIFITP